VECRVPQILEQRVCVRFVLTRLLPLGHLRPMRDLWPCVISV
jgi:hypothetical protein